MKQIRKLGPLGTLLKMMPRLGDLKDLEEHEGGREEI